MSNYSITHNRHTEGVKAEDDNASLSTSSDSIYDGVYGQISIFLKEKRGEKPKEDEEQMSLF